MSKFASDKLRKIYVEDFSNCTIEEIKEIAESKWLKVDNLNEKEILELVNTHREWVKIPVSLSYEQVTRMTAGKTEEEASKDMLLFCIKEWNMKDEDGNVPEVTPENINRLDIRVVKMISDEILPLVQNNQDKKK